MVLDQDYKVCLGIEQAVQHCQKHISWEDPKQHVGTSCTHDKAQIRSLDPRAAIGQPLEIVLWRSETTRVLVEGVVVKGLGPRKLDPLRYKLYQDQSALPPSDLPWRPIDEY